MQSTFSSVMGTKTTIEIKTVNARAIRKIFNLYIVFGSYIIINEMYNKPYLHLLRKIQFLFGYLGYY